MTSAQLRKEVMSNTDTTMLRTCSLSFLSAHTPSDICDTPVCSAAPPTKMATTMAFLSVCTANTTLAVSASSACFCPHIAMVSRLRLSCVCVKECISCVSVCGRRAFHAKYV